MNLSFCNYKGLLHENEFLVFSHVVKVLFNLTTSAKTNKNEHMQAIGIISKVEQYSGYPRKLFIAQLSKKLIGLKNILA